MKIAVMGAGALGGYLGARLAVSGQDVGFVARGAHLEAIQSDGLRVTSPNGDLHLKEVTATDTPADLGPVDMVMFMVKNRDVESAAEMIRPILGPDTFVVTCQNGVTAPFRVGEIVGLDRVVPGVARFPADIAAPGVIRHSAPHDGLTFGELGGGGSARCDLLHAALAQAGTSPSIHPNITHDMWNKLVGLSVLSGMTAMTRLDMGPIRETPKTGEMFQAALAEAEAVARAEVPDLPAGGAEAAWSFMATLPPSMHASMLDDLERGKPLELDYLSGDIVRYGQKHGIPTPLHATFVAALWAYRDGRPETTYG